MQTQALWQQDEASTIIGALRGSSLLIDEEKSGLNERLAESVRQGRWARMSLLEVNHVCNGGEALLEALRDAF